MNLLQILSDVYGQNLALHVVMPLLLAGIMIAGRRDLRRAIVILAIATLILLAGGTMLFDFAVGLMNVVTVETLGVADSLHASLANIASFMVAAGYVFCLAALALATYHAVHSHRRKWFALLLICFTLLIAIGTVPFPRLIFDIIVFSPELSDRILTGSPPGLTGAFYLGLTALTTAVPLATLIYGMRASLLPDAQRPPALATSDETTLPTIEA